MRVDWKQRNCVTACSAWRVCGVAVLFPAGVRVYSISIETLTATQSKLETHQPQVNGRWPEPRHNDVSRVYVQQSHVDVYSWRKMANQQRQNDVSRVYVQQSHVDVYSWRKMANQQRQNDVSRVYVQQSHVDVYSWWITMCWRRRTITTWRMKNAPTTLNVYNDIQNNKELLISIELLYRTYLVQ